MSVFNVVLTQPMPPSGVERLRRGLGDGFAVIDVGNKPLTEQAEPLATADTIVGQTFTAEMSAFAPRLRAIHALGAGTDGISRAALRPGCMILNCYEHDVSIAEFVLGQALALTREIVRFDRNLRQRGDFSPSGFFGGPPTRDLRGRTFGIVGYGRIGRETARLARALGVEVIATKGHPDPAMAEADGLRWLGGPERLDDLLHEADFVVVCIPLSDATRGTIGAAQIAKMRPDAYLINVARGPVIDEKALYDALKENRIAGAAIDVWYNYPSTGQGDPGNYPFAELDNLIMTPHTAGWTDDTVNRRVDVVVDNFRRMAAGQPPINIVAVGS